MTDNVREASRARRTTETNVEVSVRLDGNGQGEFRTGVGFFDHMLHQISRHSGWDVSVHADGDLHIDAHHTVEDVGIVLGQCVAAALGDKAGIARYADAYAPMDESLARAVVDVSGRGFSVCRVAFPTERVGQFDLELVPEFWRAFAANAGITLHLEVLYGSNSHHMAEALFKAAARALGQAVRRDGRPGIPSTKGVL